MAESVVVRTEEIEHTVNIKARQTDRGMENIGEMDARISTLLSVTAVAINGGFCLGRDIVAE